jgi:uncharacterized protein
MILVHVQQCSEVQYYTVEIINLRCTAMSHNQALPSPIEEPGLTPTDHQILLELARDSITTRLTDRALPTVPTHTAALQRHLNVFVTLRRSNRLRGCMGNLSGNRLLGDAVQYAALSAAFEDPRFSSLAIHELDDLHIEISVLSPLCQLTNPETLAVGTHGLVIRSENQSGLLLPQVAINQGWNREKLLEGICRKAGLPGDSWKQGAKLYIFTTEIFEEEVS